MSQQGQFSLLTKRRFLPYFLTQALGAFNDNLYKNALLLLIAFGGISAQSDSALLTKSAMASSSTAFAFNRSPSPPAL